MNNGIFVPIPPVHGNYANEEVSGILSDFFDTSYEEIDKIILSGRQRNDILEVLVRYYSLHLPGLRKINSLEVLKEVFS
jgi:DNA repair protein RecO (recombination protein O)